MAAGAFLDSIFTYISPGASFVHVEFGVIREYLTYEREIMLTLILQQKEIREQQTWLLQEKRRGIEKKTQNKRKTTL